MTKRRGHNEGTICQRSDGRWVAALNLGIGDNGKRKRKYVYGSTRKEAAEKLKEAQRTLDAGLAFDVERQTVKQFLDHWLQGLESGKRVRPRTLASYTMLVNRHIIPALGHHQLRKLGPQHVQAMLDAKTASGLAPRTVQYIRAVLRKALNQAMRGQLLSRNVATLVEPPRTVRHEITFLDPAQAKALLDTARGSRFEALYAVSLALGLRQGEALGLRWQDVNLERGSLTVAKTMIRVNNQAVFGEPKTQLSRRTIIMPGFVVKALRQHRAQQNEVRLQAGAAWEAEWNLVFSTDDGQPLKPWIITNQLKRDLTAAGLPRIRWHDLRHSCASLLGAKGASAREVMEILGHSQISLTMNTYSHIIPETRRRTADLMDDLFTATGS